MADDKVEHVSGPHYRMLAQRISDILSITIAAGMDVDEAVGVTVAVAADYARDTYGNDYLPSLADIIRHRATQPMPEWEGEKR